MLDIIDGAAPNLRRVYLEMQVSRKSPDLRRVASLPRPPCKGLGNLENRTLGSGGQLLSLSIIGPRFYNLSACIHRINLTRLQTLELRWRWGVDRRGLELLAQAASRDELRRLVNLIILFSRGESEEDATWAASWRTFLYPLRSLKCLIGMYYHGVAGDVAEKYRPFSRDLYLKRTEGQDHAVEVSTLPQLKAEVTRKGDELFERDDMIQVMKSMSAAS